MIIWSGWGILTVVIAFGVGGAVSVLAAIALNAMNLVHLSNLALALGVFAAAAANWVVGTRLNNRPGQELVDKATGRTLIYRRVHSLFFVPMQWWSVPMLIGGLLVLYAALFRSAPVLPG